VHRTGVEAQRVIQVINAYPPQSFVMADAVLLLLEPGRVSTVFFVLFSDKECALGQGMVPRELVSQFLEKSL
jgi:hypothetical protein